MQWFGSDKRGTSADAIAKTSPHPARSSDVERRATEIGRELLGVAREHHAGLFSARFWSDQLMNWAVKDPALSGAVVPLYRRFSDAPDARASP